MSIESQFEKLARRLRTKSPVPIRLQLWNGSQVDLADFALREPLAKIILPTRDALRYMVSPSLSNLGRAYVEGAIDIEGRLGDVIEAGWTLARSAVQPQGRFGRLFRFWTHTRDSDRRDIEYHYDVSNDFYRLWLDENMVYSCAYFADGTEDLAAAQIKKIDHILTKLQLQPGERLLDIGCGWGALAIRAAQKFGAEVRGITLSKQQHAHATERVRELGLDRQVTIELRDYRDLLPEFEGRFDKVSSVGMFEHVGFKGLARYFSIMRAVTRDGGLMLNHGITSSDPENGETPYGGGEFIHQYVFPHGELEHISTVLHEMQKAGLEVCDVESLRRHYARTLEIWAENFEAHAEEARRLAGDRRFRIWRVYLAGCAKAFHEDWISIFQVLACKAGGGAQCTLPMSRAYQYAAGTPG